MKRRRSILKPWSRAFPKYDTCDRREAIERYVDEYEAGINRIRKEFPQRIHVLSIEEAMTPQGAQSVLTFLGIPQQQQKIVTLSPSANSSVTAHPRLGVRSVSPMDPQRCCILVPCNTHIMPETEQILRELEELGYPVHRQFGVSAIDQARSKMATDAVLDGYEETLWVDSDMVFDVAAVELIRSHAEPIVAGVYAKKGNKAFASTFFEGTGKVVFGQDGGLIKIQHAATGFLHVRREAYVAIQQELNLPICNEMFAGRPIIPFFQPMLIEHGESHWYLGEDYSFSERARQAGLKILADTRIRLWHVGNYRYGWEEAARDVERFDTFHINFEEGTATPEKPTIKKLPTETDRTRRT